MALPKGDSIPRADILAAFEAAIVVLAKTSQQHAEDIGRIIRGTHTVPNQEPCFPINPQLVPFGVVMMFTMGCVEFERRMAHAYGAGLLWSLVTRIISDELKKLPGVEAAFTELTPGELEKPCYPSAKGHNGA